MAPPPGSPSREGLVTIALDSEVSHDGGAQQRQRQPQGGKQNKQAPHHQGAHFNMPDAATANGSISSNTSSSKPGRRFCPCFSPYTLAVLAAIMGNVLEFYDFSIYGYFAPEIGKLFFPKSDPSLRAVRTFTVFAGGFLMRPLGSLILGAIGDRFGTAAALKWSIFLMTVPTVVTGCLPTYKKVGSTATFLLVACRLLQGLSVGGEFMGALLHTSDHSPPGLRGLYVGMVATFGGVGSLLGSIVSVGMRHAMSEEELLRYGWRLPFLTGSVFGLLGIFLRTQTKALKGPHHSSSSSAGTAAPTPAAASSLSPHNGGGGEAAAVELTSTGTTAASKAPATTTTQHRPPAIGLPSPASSSSIEPPTPAGFYKADSTVFDIDLVEEAMHKERQRSFRGMLQGPGLRRLAVVILIAATQSSQYYTQFVWLGTYQATLAPTKVPASVSFAVSAIQHSISILLGPTFAYLGDRIGGPKQRTLWVLAILALGAIAPPAFFPLAAEGGVGGAFAYAVVMGVCMGFVLSGNWTTWVIESLHESPARVTTTSIAYNLGAMVGGSYPMLASALAESPVLIAPVLPSACVAFFLLCLLSLLRFHPKGIFHPNNEPDRDFPSMYHPKSAIRHRMRQREKERQQRQALLSSEREEGMGVGCGLGDVRTVEEGKIGEEVGVGVVRG